MKGSVELISFYGGGRRADGVFGSDIRVATLGATFEVGRPGLSPCLSYNNY